jgi:hypothetical protein
MRGNGRIRVSTELFLAWEAALDFGQVAGLALTSVNGRSTGDQVYGFVAGLYQRTLQRSQNRRVTRLREADDEAH